MADVLWFAAAILAVLLAMAGGHAGQHLTRDHSPQQEEA